ncbi:MULTISPECIES: general stress protein [unclassified Gordonia (in: high G+C Gram-positive bacteria)]|uniref:general stress protein n=1 Tax=unclassified Gordonia (in: high G+C Gram-positive bacteria) TaxID=2657482 RepID=UPI001FFF0A79|nr:MULTISPECIES: general stress protein [unclassified Gordonia (in: high G+C Gram-positive bacteria)]UQE76290.1 magnesium transporter [Gordonia sp. PP30]
MTQPRPTPGLPTKPTGWPVGSYDTYEQAQRAVDYLSDNQFHVEKLTIVGVDLMQVERVLGRLTWGKVLGGGLASGAWFGLFVGLIISIFFNGQDFWWPIVFCVIAGMVFGVISGAIPYAATRGQRDFASTMQLVAGRYDVLCDPGSAEQARDMLTKLAL